MIVCDMTRDRTQALLFWLILSLIPEPPRYKLILDTQVLVGTYIS